MDRESRMSRRWESKKVFSISLVAHQRLKMMDVFPHPCFGHNLMVTCDDINIAPKAACERSALNNHGGSSLPTSE
ncbi:hypothetical protein NC652_034381 [Populus alba x Populus x berolinensis]|nr:hypothetical protein NC652_034381 [Populus alba x Populus x berolinensis]